MRERSSCCRSFRHIWHWLHHFSKFIFQELGLFFFLPKFWIFGGENFFFTLLTTLFFLRFWHNFICWNFIWRTSFGKTSFGETSFVFSVFDDTLFVETSFGDFHLAKLHLAKLHLVKLHLFFRIWWNKFLWQSLLSCLIWRG